MSYLQPPPDMSPVIVVKDFGGNVDQYAARTEEYRRTGREVRIHECHSACTLALGLPNACVFKDSVLKFHQAYDPNTRIPNLKASDDLLRAYPSPIQARLGILDRDFTVIRGAELIRLGIRECDAPREPQPRLITAKAEVPAPGFLGSVLGTLTGGSRATPTASPDMEPVKARLVAIVEVPLPPVRPKYMVARTPTLAPIVVTTMMTGAAPILRPGFVPYDRTPAVGDIVASDSTAADMAPIRAGTTSSAVVATR